MDRPNIEETIEGKTFGRSGRKHRVRRVGRRILRSTLLLPALLTISNGLLGFAAIHIATKEAVSDEVALYNLAVAAALLFGAMICDSLDGLVARMTRKTSSFGEQLDSLCDAVSFGVAPAVISLRVSLLAFPAAGGSAFLGRAIWCTSGVYVACALLRLARFNVETREDESAHMHFAGLPSPAAAAAVAALVLLLAHAHGEGWAQRQWLLPTAGIVLPSVTFILALLMVSRIRYPHLLNRYIRGKRSFGYLVKLVILVIAACLDPFITGAVLALGYVATGSIGAIVRKVSKRAAAPPGAPATNGS